MEGLVEPRCLTLYWYVIMSTRHKCHSCFQNICFLQIILHGRHCCTGKVNLKTQGVQEKNDTNLPAIGTMPIIAICGKWRYSSLRKAPQQHSCKLITCCLRPSPYLRNSFNVSDILHQKLCARMLCARILCASFCALQS